MTYHTSARDVAESFDTALTGGAMALGSVLISQKMDRDAAYAEAAVIRQATARMAYNRVMAEYRAEQEAKAVVAARADRYARQRQMAIIAARKAALAG
ncbi:hypothetical protein ABZT49_06080 [Methylobacterium sp. EM32]|uniref:hypothetical protein n=1 Tax=Methylobacterium sp. EM32 TaxID=3163481 RepID=UPI0033ABBBAF